MLSLFRVPELNVAYSTAMSANPACRTASARKGIGQLLQFLDDWLSTDYGPVSDSLTRS
jgi:hypothetical protein